MGAVSSIRQRGRQAVKGSIHFPCTGGQRRLWGLSGRNPGEWQDNLTTVYDIQGAIDTVLLERALHVVRSRHEALRTSIRMRGIDLVQVVHPARYRPLRATLVDRHELDAHGGISGYVARRIERPFFLSSGPLWRFELLHLGSDRSLFIVCSHHIVSDGISMEIVWHEVVIAYNELLARACLPVTSRRKSFGDFAQWLSNWTMQSHFTAPFVRYWTPVLAGPAWPHLRWHDGCRASSFRGKALRGHLPDACYRASRLARERFGVTDYVVALAAYLVTVHLHSGETDLALISPFSGRRAPGLQDVVGRLMTGHVIRYRFEPTCSAGALLSALASHVAATLDYQDLPFEWLSDEFELAARQPVDQIRFALEDFSGAVSSLGGARVNALEYGSHSGPKRDLNLYVRVYQNHWNLVVQFNQDVLSEDSVARLMQTFCAALLACAADDDTSVAQRTATLETAAEGRVQWKDQQERLIEMSSFEELKI
ncbi:hypothetical protein KAK07_24705 [Ideonella sp. 4Y16]|uniref:Condensation domain-containing protein n=1 Tax=Ideonella alba TaxID=2824118 RepID=A0A941BH14_9BURK|nr:condensation domain-containing protein [Ideonella alba]MBQ0933556.1 hypothetical protein [Ideonella alba]MBQ0946555.1 hypothetical protein [Ideonella alba]